MSIEYMTNEYIQLIIREIFDLLEELDKYSAYNDDILNHEVYSMRKRAERIKMMVTEEES